ncbi:unnamed protein product [Musa acuminata subsp. burmannicoides]
MLHLPLEAKKQFPYLWQAIAQLGIIHSHPSPPASPLPFQSGSLSPEAAPSSSVQPFSASAPQQRDPPPSPQLDQIHRLAFSIHDLPIPSSTKTKANSSLP